MHGGFRRRERQAQRRGRRARRGRSARRRRRCRSGRPGRKMQPAAALASASVYWPGRSAASKRRSVGAGLCAAASVVASRKNTTTMTSRFIAQHQHTRPPQASRQPPGQRVGTGTHLANRAGLGVDAADIRAEDHRDGRSSEAAAPGHRVRGARRRVRAPRSAGADSAPVIADGLSVAGSRAWRSSCALGPHGPASRRRRRCGRGIAAPARPGAAPRSRTLPATATGSVRRTSATCCGSGSGQATAPGPTRRRSVPTGIIQPALPPAPTPTPGPTATPAPTVGHADREPRAGAGQSGGLRLRGRPLRRR